MGRWSVGKSVEQPVVWWPADAATGSTSAEALQNIVGILSEEETERLRKRSKEVRDSLNDEVEQTRQELGQQ